MPSRSVPQFTEVANRRGLVILILPLRAMSLSFMLADHKAAGTSSARAGRRRMRVHYPRSGRPRYGRGVAAVS